MKLLVVFAFFVCAFVDGQSDVGLLRNDVNAESDQTLTLRPSFDKWQRLLLPAPSTIALLGEMMVITSKVDVSLTSVTPVGGWRLVEHPESLRASLLQIGHEGWTSFRLAHRNMNEIQQNMAMVPQHVKRALQILKRMPARMVVRVLPKALDRIGAVAELCEVLANSTELVFVNVMDLIGEIEGAVASASGLAEKNLTDTKVKLTWATVSRRELRIQQQLIRQRYSKIEREMDKSRQLYEDVIDEIPTGWKGIAMDFVKVFGNVVKQVAIMYLGSVTGVGGMLGGIMGGAGGSGIGSIIGGGMMGKVVENQVSDTIMLNVANQLQKQVGSLPDFLNQLTDGTADAGAMTALKVMSGQFLKNVGGYGKTAIQKKVHSVYSKVQRFAEEIEGVATDAQGLVGSAIEKYQRTALNLVKDGRVLVAAAAASGVDVRGQTQQQTTPANRQNERYIANLRVRELETAQRRSDETFSRMMKISTQIARVEAQIASLDITRINLQDIVQMLKQVIKLLAQMRQQWNYLIQFFTDIAIRAKTINAQVVVPFLSDSNDFARDLRDEDRAVVLEMVTDMASDVESASYFLQEIAATYVKISGRYLLGPLAGLGQMLGASSDVEREQLRQQLYVSRDEAKEGIMTEIDRVRTEYNRQLQQRRQQLEEYAHKLGDEISSEQDDQLMDEGALLANSVGRHIE